MFVVRTNLRPGRIHGIGVFAEKPIKKGQLVWKFDTRLDLRIPVAELPFLPADAQEHIRIRACAEMVTGQRVMTLCGDNSQYVNHSSHPNLLDSEDGLQKLAAWDIAAGGERTCNYYKSDLADHEKLGSYPVEV
ncbi:MAG TPA: SET domain-containing protein-lysine N-methyltransferase [Anaerolineales bacterium]